MFQTAPSVSRSFNGMGTDLTDGSGTINPAALNSPVLPPSSAEPGPRGLKRSRSPDQYGLLAEEDEDDDDTKPRKRGRPPKPSRTSGEISSLSHAEPPPPPASALSCMIQIPQSKPEPPVQPIAATPSQASPPAPSKQAPPKSSVKALPTVRDHTSDQLGPEGDEYIPREFDDAGEKKVDELGYPQGGRQLKCRTFTVPKRGQKLFMLATECARVLNYRDSYLLFNKNRSLYKIIATQPEKDHLINQEILPYSYRSRQIAIVAAKSMFRQFGSRVIVNGRRVRDDYWESKARKQGFTEDDLAGEKRPGGAKTREAAAAESQLHALPTFAHGDIVYSNGPVFDGIHPHQLPPSLAATFRSSSAMNLATGKDFGNIARPRLEMSGAPYHDRSQPSNARDIMNQAAQTADFNKSLNQSRNYRGKELEEFWSRPREPATPAATAATPQPSVVEPAPGIPVASQPSYHSPRFANTENSPQPRPPNILPQQSSHHPTPSPMNSASYGAPQNHAQSPIHRQSNMQAPMRDSSQYQPQQGLHRSPSNVPLGHDQQASSHAQNPYGYASSPHPPQMWGAPPPQPQASPSMNRMQNPQFSPSLNNLSGQQMTSPIQAHHQSQSPHPPQQIHAPQVLPQAGAGSLSSQQIYGGGISNMQGGGISNMQGGHHGYPAMGSARQLYPGGQNQQAYLHSHPGQAGSVPGWPAVSHAQQGGWTTY